LSTKRQGEADGDTVIVIDPQKKKAEGGLLPKEGRGTMKTARLGVVPNAVCRLLGYKAYADKLKSN
jgi:hypothetical protein